MRWEKGREIGYEGEKEERQGHVRGEGGRECAMGERERNRIGGRKGREAGSC